MNAPLQTAEVHVAAKIDMVCFKPAKDMPPHELEAPSNEQKDDKQHSVWGGGRSSVRGRRSSTR